MLDRAFVNRSCFDCTSPVVVPAQTLLSQLAQYRKFLEVHMKRIMSLWFVLKRNLIHLVSSTGYSLKGLRTCAHEELAFRQELLWGVVHCILIFALPISCLCRIVLTVLYLMILVVELINTAIEAAVDLVTTEVRPLAKKAKDCASAAVFLTLVAYVLSWVCICMLNFR